MTAGATVAITGSARGIGRATAQMLTAAGARVAIGDIDAAAARAAAAAVGGNAIGTRVDVTDEESFSEWISEAESQLGPLDVLINNAGIMPIGPYLDESIAVAKSAIDVNLLGCLIGMKTVLPGMLTRGKGHIINISSVAGRAPVPGGLTYAATKAGVLSATETARVEFAGRGVLFTSVMPSFTNTELIAGTQGTRFVRTIEPEDVAAAIVAVIESPRPDVFVPRSVGAILRVTPLIGRRLRDAMNRSLKADRTFLEIDRGARAEYDRRISPPEEQRQLEP